MNGRDRLNIHMELTYLYKTEAKIGRKQTELDELMKKYYESRKYIRNIFKNEYKNMIEVCYWYDVPKEECFVILPKSKEDCDKITKDLDTLLEKIIGSWKVEEIKDGFADLNVLIKSSSYLVEEPLKDRYVISLYI